MLGNFLTYVCTSSSSHFPGLSSSTPSCWFMSTSPSSFSIEVFWDPAIPFISFWSYFLRSYSPFQMVLFMPVSLGVSLQYPGFCCCCLWSLISFELIWLQVKDMDLVPSSTCEKSLVLPELCFKDATLCPVHSLWHICWRSSWLDCVFISASYVSIAPHVSVPVKCCFLLLWHYKCNLTSGFVVSPWWLSQ